MGEVSQEDIRATILCTECHRPLTRMKWNKKGDLLLCRENCPRYGQPQGWVPVEIKVPDAIFFAPKKRGKKGDSDHDNRHKERVS